MTLTSPPVAPVFDPFSHRLDRDIRNTLAKALIDALHRGSDEPVSDCTRRWPVRTLPQACRAYLSARLAAYRDLVALFPKTPAADEATIVAIVLWNRGLFFECHEWLETLWHSALPPRKNALKGWILAAGAFSHQAAGRPETARSLAMRAAAHLSAAGPGLLAMGDIEGLIQALIEDPPRAVVLSPAPPPSKG